MSPQRKMGIAAHRKAAQAGSEIIPEPPETCDGYVYTVEYNDTLYNDLYPVCRTHSG